MASSIGAARPLVHPVDEEDAVQVVDLVEEAAGEEARAVEDVGQAGLVLELGPRATAGALHVAADLRERKAALL